MVSDLNGCWQSSALTDTSEGLDWRIGPLMNSWVLGNDFAL